MKLWCIYIHVYAAHDCIKFNIVLTALALQCYYCLIINIHLTSSTLILGEFGKTKESITLHCWNLKQLWNL